MVNSSITVRSKEEASWEMQNKEQGEWSQVLQVQTTGPSRHFIICGPWMPDKQNKINNDNPPCSRWVLGSLNNFFINQEDTGGQMITSYWQEKLGASEGSSLNTQTVKATSSDFYSRSPLGSTFRGMKRMFTANKEGSHCGVHRVTAWLVLWSQTSFHAALNEAH